MIEITTFRLAPGTDTSAFLAADKRVQTEYFYLRDGLGRRTTARNDDGEWLVVTLWDSAASAEAADTAAPGDPAASAFWALVDAASVRTSRYEELGG